MRYHVLFMLCLVQSLTASDMFSSIADIERLFEFEKQLVGNFRDFVVETENRLRAVKKYLEDHEEVAQQKQNMTKSTGHPVNAFHLMRRLTVMWHDVKQAFNRTQSTREVERLVETETTLPTPQDFSGAAFALVLLQKTYNMNMSLLVEGKVHLPGQAPQTSAHTLKARDCLFIGKHAFNKGEYGQAVEWLQKAQHLAELEDTLEPVQKSTAKKEEISPFLNTAIRVHDDVLAKKGPLGKEWRTGPNFLDPKLKKRLPPTGNGLEINWEKLRVSNFQQDPKSLLIESEIFSRLCRGEKLRTPRQEKILKCRLVSHTHPFFTIRPLKLEEASHVPYLIVFHDFMNDGEMKLFKQAAVNELERSTHGGKRGFTASDKRTSKQKWVRDEDHTAFEVVARRISAAVQLKHTPYNIGSEHYQVANYGVGGQYTPHSDWGVMAARIHDPSLKTFTDRMDEIRGDRIATFMAYLEDVELGGATAFPLAGTAIWPKKGSAAFWWNLYSDGVGDILTRHGACPVLHGSKWICNKWYHSNEQPFLKPCALEPLVRIRYP